MNKQSTEVAQQPAEQLAYAHWLDWGTRIGSALLLVTFVLYLSGWMAPLVSLDRLPKVWNLPVGKFLSATGQPAGWGWLRLAGHSDIANLVGIGVLAGCSMLCLLVVTRMYLRRGDRVFAAICVAEVLVLVLAASGVLTSGH